MKFLWVLLLSVYCGLCQADAAESSAKEWLALVDAGDYESSWEQAAPFFQNNISQAKWAGALTQVRAPLGELMTRELSHSASKMDLPGAPKGEYLIMRLSTTFLNQVSAVETLTLQQGSQGWRVVGYFIK